MSVRTVLVILLIPRSQDSHRRRVRSEWITEQTRKEDDDRMFHSVRGLNNFSIGATDGPVGHVRDAYIDDQRWRIRYLVVQTGHWLGGRRVLISPLSLRGVDLAHRTLPTTLTKGQVAGSPDIDTDKPVSRQHEL